MDFKKLDNIAIQLFGCRFKGCKLHLGTLALLVYKGIYTIEEAKETIEHVGL